MPGFVADYVVSIYVDVRFAGHELIRFCRSFATGLSARSRDAKDITEKNAVQIFALGYDTPGYTARNNNRLWK